MKITAVNTIQNHSFWLLGIGSGLTAIIMTIIWKSGDASHLGMCLLFLFAAGSMLWEQRHKFILESDLLSSLVGILVIACVLWQSVFLLKGQGLIFFTRMSPFIAAIGVGLLASGFQGLKQYWKQITMLFFIGGPELILTHFIHFVTPITAKVSALLLWYSGFEVVLEKQVYIYLPTGSIVVNNGCSGVAAMSYLLGVSMIALLMFPIERSKRIFVPIIAAVIAFVINAIRVAFLAVIVTNKPAFDYWHEGDGSRFVGMIGILIFGLLYYFYLSRSQEKISQP